MNVLAQGCSSLAVIGWHIQPGHDAALDRPVAHCPGAVAVSAAAGGADQGAYSNGLALILWAALTTFWSAAPLDTLNALWQVAILGAICFLLGSQSGSLRPFFIAAAASEWPYRAR